MRNGPESRGPTVARSRLQGYPQENRVLKKLAV